VQHDSIFPSSTTMAPPHTRREKEDRNQQIYALHKHTDMGYGKIAKAIGVCKATVQKVVTRADARGGNTHYASKPGRPTKITEAKRKSVEAIIDAEPHLALRDITQKANIGLGKTTIDKIISKAGFKLLILRKKPFWRKGQKEKRKEFARRRRNWRGIWNWVVFVDEATIIYDPNPAGRKVRIRPGEELEEKNLKPSFKSGRTSIGVYAAIMKGGRTELILVRKRGEEERTSKRDRLGLNSHQYATEIHQPHLIPFIEGLDRPSDNIYLAADNASWHGGEENQKLQADCGYKKLPWPPNSPDLNPIENTWALLKRALTKRFSKLQRRPHSAVELFEAAKEEWNSIPQETLDAWINRMPERIQAVLDADGGHTKW
jgi:transposase